MTKSEITHQDVTPTVVLKMTVTQAQAVVDSLDLYTRLSMGQVNELAAKFASGEFKIKATDRSDRGRIASDAELLDIRDHCWDLKTALGHYENSSFSIGNRAVSDTAHRAYELTKTIEKALAEFSDPAPSFKRTQYDGLTVRYTNDPAPYCEVQIPGVVLAR
jgi:hypothetical protein